MDTMPENDGSVAVTTSRSLLEDRELRIVRNRYARQDIGYGSLTFEHLGFLSSCCFLARV
jgi:hypothetical protein